MMASLQHEEDFSHIQGSVDGIEIFVTLQSFCKGRVLPVDIVIKGIVAAQGNQRTQTQPIREEDLSGSIKPHLKNTGRKYPFEFNMFTSNIHQVQDQEMEYVSLLYISQSLLKVIVF